MKHSNKFLMMALVMSVVISMPVTQSFAVNSWHNGGTDNTLPSSTTEINGDVKVPPTPNSQARSDNTLIWIGGETEDDYLSQVELRAWTSTYWKVFFEIVENGFDRVHIWQTSLNAYNGDTVEMDTKIYPSTGMNCFYAQKGSTTVSKCYYDIDYGDQFNKAWAELESYDYTGGDFASMNDIIEFTSVQGYNPSSYSIVLDDYETGNPTPNCITPSAGTGWTDIDVDC